MIENGNMSPADFSALMGNNRGYGGFGNGDGQGWWILLLFLFMFNGGYGGFGNRSAVYDTQADIQRGLWQESAT